MTRYAGWMTRLISVVLVTAGCIVGIAEAHGVPATAARVAPIAPAAPSPATEPTLAVPTLGLAHRDMGGFGKVRPGTVDYGGDGTSLVWHVHWITWGGDRAIGHGTADWVWPGWCIACGSENLPATVVAFDLQACGGHPAYARVEWYFPSRGMTFDTRLSSANACTGRFDGASGEPPHASCRAVGLTGGTARSIAVYGYGLSCATARRVLPQLGAVRYLRRNARWHHGAWWCGSELSMQPHRSPPQSFSCVSGDYDELSFTVFTRRR